MSTVCKTVVLMLVFSMVGTNCIAATVKWTGNGNDGGLWANAANWNGGVPISSSIVQLDPARVSGAAVIDPYVSAVMDQLNWSVLYANPPYTSSITMRSYASLTCTNAYNYIGAWGNDATLYVRPAAVFTSTGRIILGFTRGSKGTLQMTGGTFTAWGLHVGYNSAYGPPAEPNGQGRVYLSGGIITLTNNLVIYTNNANNFIDLTGSGELRINGNCLTQINSWIAGGWIKNSGGYELATDYNVSNPGYTTVKATLNRLYNNSLLYNGSFERGFDGWTSIGQVVGWGNMSGLYGTIDTNNPWHGSQCLKIELGPGITSKNYFDFEYATEAYQTAPMAITRGWMSVTQGASYTLSAYVRATQGTPMVKMGYRKKTGESYTTNFYPTTSWQRYSYTFTAPENQLFVQIGPSVADANTSATVYMDAVQFEQAASATAFLPAKPVEIGLNTNKYGNVFSSGESVVANVVGRNNTAVPVSITLNGTLTDFFGTVRATPHFEVNIPAYSSVNTPWTLPLPGYGYYQFQANYNAYGSNCTVNLIRLAYILPYLTVDSPFGMNHIPETDNLKTQHHKIGMTWYRSWSFLWDAIEHTQNVLTWGVLDNQVPWARAGGHNVIGEFHQPSTLWASSAPVGDTDLMRRAYPPTNASLMTGFLGTMVARYDSNVPVWEFLNEPATTDWAFPISRGFTVGNYVSLLSAAYPVIKQANPSSIVVAGPEDNGTISYTTQFIDSGGLSYCDKLGMHAYPQQTAPETWFSSNMNLSSVVSHMNQHGQLRPIWMTEFAYYGVDDHSNDVYWWDYSWCTANEMVAAKYLIRGSIMMLANGVQKILYQCTGGGSPNYEWPENPFVTQQGEPRKAYPLMAVLARRLGAYPTYSGAIIGSGRYRYAFQTYDGRGVLISWCTSGSPRLVVPAACNAYSFEGNALNLNGLYLSDLPLYVDSTTYTGAQLLSLSSIQ